VTLALRASLSVLRARLVVLLGVLAVVVAAVALTPPRALGAAPPQLSVTGASLTVAATGQRLYGDNADKELLIASTTKMMTALVVLQHVKNLSEIFTAPDFQAASVDSQIGLEPGEKMSVHDLMLAVLLPSADDAAYDLAYNVGGDSVAHFVSEMNADAVALGLTHTHYENPIGLDSPENYSSPYDLTRLAAYMLAHYPFFAASVRLTHATLDTGNYVRNVTNTDTLLGTEPWITGVKTGHTNAAGYILVSSGTQDGLTLIGSVLGTASEAARNANALALLQYGFAEFHQVTAIRKGEVIKRLPVTGESSKAVVIARADWQKLLPKGDRVSFSVKLPSQLTGPLKAHSQVGAARILVNGRDVGTVLLITGRAVPAESMLTKVAHLLGGTTTLGVLALVLGVVLTASELRRRRPRQTSRRRAELEAR
jgi:serine-type D-Ala-D-Ala carboxypeptidase (penicillin-binding protein 5/6)